MLGYDLIAIRTRVDKSIELGKELRNCVDEGRAKLEDSEDDVLCVW